MPVSQFRFQPCSGTVGCTETNQRKPLALSGGRDASESVSSLLASCDFSNGETAKTDEALCTAQLEWLVMVKTDQMSREQLLQLVRNMDSMLTLSNQIFTSVSALKPSRHRR